METRDYGTGGGAFEEVTPVPGGPLEVICDQQVRIAELEARVKRLQAVALPARQLTRVDRYTLAGGAVILSLMAAFRALEPGDQDEEYDG